MIHSGGVVRFTNLILENWRNFTHVEGALARRVIVTGPNASGKSNLLDALRFLREVASGGGLQQAVRRRGGMARLRCLAVPAAAQVALEVRVAADEGGPEWEYELRFAEDAKRRPVVARERVSAGGRDILVRPDALDRDDPQRLLATALEQVHSNREFRELAEFLASVREVENAGGAELAAAIAALPENAAASRLRRILDLVRPLVAQLEALDFHRDARGTPHLRARFGYSHGAWQREEQLSSGTLRMIALLWAALDGSGPLLAEEPERSLGPAAAREILPMLRAATRRTERQTFLATHSRAIVEEESVLPEEVLLLEPGEDGTTARTPSPFAAPVDEEQLALFGDA
ncbi:MAG TPA: AAA family ATPase [Bryobacteraceae bacterium]|nr:AAA family ATPase [Bryobacteraceae bacterium]